MVLLSFNVLNVNSLKLIYILWSFFFHVNTLKSATKFVRVFKFFLPTRIRMCPPVDGSESSTIEAIMSRAMLHMLRAWYTVISGAPDTTI